MKFLIMFLSICLISSASYAQDKVSDQKNPAAKQTQLSQEELFKDKNLSEQFVIFVGKSESFNEYKVIKKTKLNSFWQMVQDSISILKQDIASSNEIIASQSAETKNMESIISKKDEELSRVDFAMTHINFLGTDFDKTTFIIINTAVILGLAGLIITAFFLYWRSNVVSTQKIRECNAIEDEFDTYKKHSLEKQVKLNRELQTAINTLEEIQLNPTLSKTMHA